MKKDPQIPGDIGIIIVDHGSRFRAANDMLDEVVALFKQQTGAAIVEPAHMELAEPTIEQALAICVEQGARRVIVHPYFLSPGRHSSRDIPGMAEEAAAKFPGVSVVVTEPLGVDSRITDVCLNRIEEALGHES